MASRALTTIATNEMLNAMWLRMIVPIPSDWKRGIDSTIGSVRICVKKMSSITAIVTSGMMIGR